MVTRRAGIGVSEECVVLSYAVLRTSAVSLTANATWMRGWVFTSVFSRFDPDRRYFSRRTQCGARQILTMANTKRTSQVWIIPAHEFIELVRTSKTLSEIGERTGLKAASGGSFRIIKERIRELNIDAVHIKLGSPNRISKPFCPEPLPLEMLLVENCRHSRKTLKKRLLVNGVFENKCSICGLDGMWNGKKLVMRLDHINGVNDDNRIDNLRMVCPNCDSQLETFSGGNVKRAQVRPVPLMARGDVLSVVT